MIKIDTSNFTQEELREYLFKLRECQEVNISNKELSEIRKKVDKALFKIEIKNETMDMIYTGRLCFEEDEDDYRIYTEDEYKEELNRVISEGGNEKDLKELIKENKKCLNEIKIMKYRFKEKYSWKKISQEVGLSERQCQRIKDKILNRYIIDILENKNMILYDWEFQM